MSQTSDLKNFCKSSGADLVGIADLEPLKHGLPTVPESILARFKYAVSVAIRLDTEIINSITDHPTPEYAGHYRNINASLDALTSGLVQWILQQGYHAQAIPASRIVDETNLLGNVSHKAVARMAGIGWQGKSLLIISPEFGPKIRLATVLTDMDIEPDTPVKNRCGECSECAKACPASAIKNVSTNSYYTDRHDALYFNRCADKTWEFNEMPGIGARICGVCVKACPFGRKRGENKKSLK
jgi:epoxyqueuosine reductase QueG